MSDIWFTADLHLSHENIVTGFRGADRGPRYDFAPTIEQHDENIVTLWNETVKPGDKVYVLGDVALNKRGLNKVLQLAGKKRIVLGNHDNERAISYVGFFERVYGAKCLDGMLLTHIPIHPASLNRRSMQVNVHGHLHEKVVESEFTFGGVVPDRRYRCVSLEQTGFRPIHYDEVVTGFGELLK